MNIFNNLKFQKVGNNVGNAHIQVGNGRQAARISDGLNRLAAMR